MKKYFGCFCLIIILGSTNYLRAQLTEVNYADGEQRLQGFATKPKEPQKIKAGVLILPAWMGISDHSKKVAEELSTKGYYTFIADIYGVGNKPKDTKEAAAKSAIYKNDVNLYRRRIKLALEQLIKHGADKDNIVIIGYCFGGQGALEAARANFPVKGVVSFHGGLKRDEKTPIENITPKVLVLHGADDPFIPETDIKNFQDEMRKAKADWQMIYYANAVHAFTEPAAGNDNSKGTAYNQEADTRSWNAMLDFLFEAFFGFPSPH